MRVTVFTDWSDQCLVTDWLWRRIISPTEELAQLSCAMSRKTLTILKVGRPPQKAHISGTEAFLK